MAQFAGRGEAAMLDLGDHRPAGVERGAELAAVAHQ
jgi:hypothetical protein